MKKYFFILFFLILPWLPAVAQDSTIYFTNESVRTVAKTLTIGITGGYAKYMQNDLEKINNDVQKGLNFDTKLIENFPATIYYGFYFLFRVSHTISLGLDYQYHTTGSRIAYRDYSGSYTYDQIISCHSPAVRLEISSPGTKKPQSILSLLIGTNISSWKAIEKLKVGETVQNSDLRLDAFRPFLYPGLKFKIHINSMISIVPSVGFDIDLFGKYHLRDDKYAKTDQIAGWSGPRAELNFEMSFLNRYAEAK